MRRMPTEQTIQSCREVTITRETKSIQFCCCGLSQIIRSSFCTVISLILVFHFSSAAPAAEDESKWLPWYELGGFYGSDDGSRGEVALFAPFEQRSRALGFVDLRGKLFEENVSEFNLASGYRWMLHNGWNLGAWGGLDARESSIDNRFYQLSAGFDALHSDFDFRVNGYAALSDPKMSPELAQVRLSGNRILMVGGEEIALSGADIEVGARVPLERFLGGVSAHELRVYAGGFHFDDDDALQDVSGPKVRVAWRVNDVISAIPGSRLTFEAEFSNDNVRDSRWEGGIRLSIPFSTSKMPSTASLAALSAQERRMTERLERDTDIITAQSDEEPVIDPATGMALNRLAIANGGTSLQRAILKARRNGLVIVQGTHTGNAVLNRSQTLAGGGSSLTVLGRDSGTTSSFTVPGSPARIRHTGDSAALTLERHNHVLGLHLVGAGRGSGLVNNVGILGRRSLGNVTLANNTITDFGNDGIALRKVTTNRDLLITNNTILRVGLDGVIVRIIDDAVVSAEIRGNRVRGVIQDGIDIHTNDNSKLTYTVENNIVRNAGDDGLDFDFLDNSRVRLFVYNNLLTGSQSNGMEFDIEDTSRVFGTMSNNTINSIVGEGIEFDQDNNSHAKFKIIGNTVTATTDDPLDIDLEDESTGLYRVADNLFLGDPGTDIDIDTKLNCLSCLLSLQMFENVSRSDFNFDELGTTTFELEDTLDTNTLRGSAIFDIDAGIKIVPFGTFFDGPEN